MQEIFNPNVQTDFTTERLDNQNLIKETSDTNAAAQIYKKFIDPSLIKDVYQQYEMDFELLGYDLTGFL